jgi:hypothetical protein
MPISADYGKLARPRARSVSKESSPRDRNSGCGKDICCEFRDLKVTPLFIPVLPSEPDSASHALSPHEQIDLLLGRLKGRPQVYNCLCTLQP